MTERAYEAKREGMLKRDVLGRVQTSRERREVVLDEYERSGLSGPKFAEVMGIKYATFATWLQKRRKRYSGLRGSSLAV